MPATARLNWRSGSAKRSPSRSAIGRAPIATMSRRIPPIPVAAPWNGSTADGWLCDSTLKATATPSPRSRTPAFSPGPWRTRSPCEGSRFRSGAECLYPQCSDQSSEKTASSKWFGSRPSSAWIRSASQSVRPRARWSGCSATCVRRPSVSGETDGPPAALQGGVRSRYAVMLATVALLWGSSFLFIKVAVRELAPATLIMGRLGLGALALAAIVPLMIGGRRTLDEIRQNAGWLLLVALVNVAVPFWLLSWGETRIDSGLASILQAAVPIFNAVVAFGFFREVRVTGLRLVGVGIGFVGVALLVGAQPNGKVLGALAVVGMALCYAVGQLLAGRHLADVSPPVVAFATTGIAALVALPFGIAQAPHDAPGWKT